MSRVIVDQRRVSERGTRNKCMHCAWRFTIRDAGGRVGVLRTEAMKHVRQTGHTVRRYLEDITEYAPEADQ